MKTTNDFNDRKYLTEEAASLAKDNLKLGKKIKNMHISYNVSYFALIIVIILFCRNCAENRENQLQGENSLLTQKVDKLEHENNNLKNRKAVLEINEAVSVVYVSAVIADMNDPRPTEQPINPIRVSYPVFVPKVDSSAIIMAEDCAKNNEALMSLYLEEKDSLDKVNKLLNDTIEVCADKTYRQDSSAMLMKERFPLRSFLSDIPPSINYSHPYAEYLSNSYRDKAEKNFWWGVGLAGGSVALYGVSEALGHPKFRDDIDNSDAQKKSDLILGLRIGSGVLAAASIFEFGRTIHFHNMEGKFIVDPTKFGVVLYLDK